MSVTLVNYQLGEELATVVQYWQDKALICNYGKHEKQTDAARRHNRFFSSPEGQDKVCVTPPRVISAEVKRPGREGDHSPPAEV